MLVFKYFFKFFCQLLRCNLFLNNLSIFVYKEVVW